MRLVQRAHRRFVGLEPGTVRRGGVVRVQGEGRPRVGLLARGGVGRELGGSLRGLQRPLEAGGRGRHPGEGVAEHRHGDAPVRHGAARVGGRGLLEGPFGGVEPEGVQHGDAAFEVRLRGRRARRRELHAADALGGVAVVVVLRGGGACGEERGRDGGGADPVEHGASANGGRWMALGFAA